MSLSHCSSHLLHALNWAQVLDWPGGCTSVQPAGGGEGEAEPLLAGAEDEAGLVAGTAAAGALGPVAALPPLQRPQVAAQ